MMYWTFICVLAPNTGISLSVVHMSNFSIYVKLFSPALGLGVDSDSPHHSDSRTGAKPRIELPPLKSLRNTKNCSAPSGTWNLTRREAIGSRWSYRQTVKLFSPRSQSRCRLKLSAPLRTTQTRTGAKPKIELPPLKSLMNTKNRSAPSGTWTKLTQRKATGSRWSYRQTFLPPLSVSVSTQALRTTQTLAPEKNQKPNYLRWNLWLIKKSLSSLWDIWWHTLLPGTWSVDNSLLAPLQLLIKS